MPWRTIGGRFEMRVAETAVAAARDNGARSHFGQIGEKVSAVGVENLRARRNFQDDVGGVGAGPVSAHAVPAGLCLEMLLITVIDQRVQARIAQGDDVAAGAAVATVGAAEFDE